MQNNNLPHSPSAPDSKAIVQNTNNSSNQTHLQSTSSLNVVSTVPLSSNSASSPTCNANIIASSLNVQTQVSDSTDARRLPTPERCVATSSGNISSSSDSHKLQNNHQCNISSVSNGKEHTDNVNTETNVQNVTNIPSEHKSLSEENTLVNEVQNNTDVNKSPTAIVTESLESDSVKNQLDSLASQPSDNDKCKKFSNLNETSDLSLSSITPVPNDNKKDVVLSHKEVETRKSPIAQIISVDNLPIQTNVIEVPSQSSPAVPKILAKSGQVAEASSVSTLVPSFPGSASSSVLSLSVQQESSKVLHSNVSPNGSTPITVSLRPECLPIQSLPCSTSAVSRVSLVNHVDAMQETPLSAKGSPASSTNPSEESSMDSIDEERKRCMQLAEIPTSTPGPPHTSTVSSSKDAQVEENVHIVPLNVKPVNKAVTKPSTLDVLSEGMI